MIGDYLRAVAMGVDLSRQNDFYLYKLKRAEEIKEHGENVKKQIEDFRERIKSL